MSAPIETREQFLAAARERYVTANAGTLDWMLERSAGSDFVDTKLNAITLADYGADDGVRGPDFTYGWIQGRALEAIVTHAAFFEREDPALAQRLDAAGRRLYGALDALQRRHGRAFFCYDRALNPVYLDADGKMRGQSTPPDIATYSDAFVAKGLIAAAHRYAFDDLACHLDYFGTVIAAIETRRFQMDERVPLTTGALVLQPDDIGPRMILLGAAGLLVRLGLGEHARYGERFIAHVIGRHYDSATGLLRNVPDGDECNVGHGIEFVGFALDYLEQGADPEFAPTLEKILIASFRAGFIDPGIALSVSVGSGEILNANCPWWSLPETIRSAALCYGRTGSAGALQVWRDADAALFSRYWRGTPPIAYQTLTKDGPLDFVPATPDLDPGYHTGLSLLAAIHVADAGLAGSPVSTQA